MTARSAAPGLRHRLGVRCGAALVLLLAFGMAPASERILAHDIDIRVLDDGRLDVTERLHVRAEGRRIRHGIVRDIPTHGVDRHGARITGGFAMGDVQRDGHVEPWRLERHAGGVRVHIGDTGFLPLPSEPVYTLRYRTTRQIGFGLDGDALDWTVIGPDHPLPVDRARVRVTLPAAVPVARLQADGVTGNAGRDVQVALSASGSATWTTTRALVPGEALAIRLAFPRGLVAPPSRAQTARWWLQDHLGPLLAGAGLLVLLAYCALRWRRLGRDVEAGAPEARPQPPPGLSPGGLRYIRRRRYDIRCATSDLLASAVDDHVHLRRERDGRDTGWRVTRTRAGAHTLPTMEQRALLASLLPDDRDTLTLDPSDAARVRQALQAHHTALRRRFQPAMFRPNGASILIALAIALVSGSAAIAVAAGSAMLLATLGLVTLMLPVLLVFAALVKTPTDAGRAMLGEIEGLRRHLVASGRVTRDAAPALDAARYAFLLPYAVALEVEDAWTRQFRAAVGDAEATRAVDALPWYTGIAVTDLGRFSRSMGSSLAARLAAASTPPGRRGPPQPDPSAAGDVTDR
ncbi:MULTISPECIES: DUF2207 domain-containing protein [Luteimonas]|uniref:DUF2207 domain-containing protein n=1 Tax=Luteimonas TaxID=83614 RepID=UPI000C7DC566|nr:MULTISPECIES: DUF2207 domain-containing protein [Luteimonas]